MADRLQSLAPPESLGAGAPGSPGGADALVPTRGAANPEIQSGSVMSFFTFLHHSFLPSSPLFKHCSLC